jgi:hypothetical protein
MGVARLDRVDVGDGQPPEDEPRRLEMEPRGSQERRRAISLQTLTGRNAADPLP